MNDIKEQFLWTEKYRPKTVEQAILPAKLKARLQKFVDQQQLPNMLLTGPAGVGKTTVARAMVEQIGCTYTLINGSLEGNIDTLRNDIRTFASTVSFDGNRKYVIIDEADYLNPNTTQPALRGFIEEFASNCGFILTCNYPNRIIPAISQSRLAVIDFTINSQDKIALSGRFLKRAQEILQLEKIEYDNKVLVELINRYLTIGGWRRIIHELQQYSVNGKIDVGILYNFSETQLANLFEMIKSKNFTDARNWIADNHIDGGGIYKTVYDYMSTKITKQSIPLVVMMIAKYQYQAAFVADQQINFAAFVAEMMAEDLAFL